MSVEQLELHPSWPRITDDQRRAVNEVWDDTVIPALEQVDVMRKERDAALLEAQDARGSVRRMQEHCDAKAERDRERRRELHDRVAQLETRVLELEGMRDAA